MSNDFLLGQIFKMPPVTRCMALSIVLVTLLVYTDTVSPYSLFYSPLFLKKFEVWRIFTSFLYFGKPTLDVFMHIVFLYRYSRMLEEGCINTSEYFWMILIISSILFAISNIYGIPTLGTSFSATITYIWTKRNPRAIVQIFGFISFPAFYLPFILPGFMLLSRRSISIDDVLGIAVGHVFYYFKDVYPRWGSNVLSTPCWVKKIFNEHPASCCKSKETSSESKKGITIGEGRARYERSKAQNDGVSTENNRVDVSDTKVTSTRENDIEDKSVIHSVLNEEPNQESSLFLDGNSTTALQEGSFASTGIHPTESLNDTSGLCSTIVEQDEAQNLDEAKDQSEDEWEEKWGVESSEESSG